MTSILTNIAAMSALQTLRTINSGMEETQGRVSSGLRVGEAGDNAAYWSIATTMRSDNMALSAVQDALGLGASKVDTAYAGMESAIEVVKEIKSKLVAATEQGVDKEKIQEEVKQLQDQLKAIAQSATFTGQNWIMGETADKTVVSGFTRDSNNVVAVKTTTYAMNADLDGNVLFESIDDTTNAGTGGILGTAGNASGLILSEMDVAADIDYDIGSTATNTIANVIQDIDDALRYMTSAGAELGSISMRIDLQEEFVAKLSDSIESGIGRLVDADMNEESTRLKALQTQQQLGIQALSIANSSSENILSLFR